MKQAAPVVLGLFFFFTKEVAFIPQLKSPLWQIARFTAGPEWHIQTSKGNPVVALKANSYRGKTKFEKAVICELWSCYKECIQSYASRMEKFQKINKNLTNKTSINLNNLNLYNLCTTIKNIFTHIFLGTFCIVLCAICSQWTRWKWQIEMVWRQEI